MTQPPPLPEVRQCQDPASQYYGRTATAAFDQFTGEARPGVWMIANPQTGGHWTHTSEPEGKDIESWPVLVASA